MSAAQKLALRKELEKFHAVVATWKRDDLVTGRWFGQFIDRTLGGLAATPTPADVRAKYKGSTEPDDLADDIVSETIRRAILATDAYKENLSGTEIRILREKKTGGEQRLTGDMVALVAELLYTAKLDVDLMFEIAAAFEKQLNAGQTELFEEAFGRGLGNFDYDKARQDGNALDQIGAKIYDRAIIQTVGSSLADAQRKGFYCFYAKAIAKSTRDVATKLPKWEAPKAEEATGAMRAGSADEEPPAYY